MLQQISIKNLTVFPEATLKVGRHLNVFVGKNGTGKTHLLKLAYSVLASSAEGRKSTAATPTKSIYQPRLAEKLVNVFRPETLGRLASRQRGRARCDISLAFANSDWDIDFSFAANSRSEVAIGKLPLTWLGVSPVYLPTRELLTIYPGFVSLYEGHHLAFEETWRDTCLLLGAALQRGPREVRIKTLVEPLEEAMGGSIVLEDSGRFYLRNADGRMEMPLVAEGLRKLGMIARLIATGGLSDKGFLFWDEPEANLHPAIVKGIANSILGLSAAGIQTFIATHSLFLLREIEILLFDRKREAGAEKVDVRFFGLHESDNGVTVEQGSTIDDIGDLTLVDEELMQSDRFLGMGD